MRTAFSITLAIHLVFWLPGPAAGQAVAIGYIQQQTGGDFQALEEWRWTLRGGGIQLTKTDLKNASRFPLIIVDDTALDEATTERLADWVSAGGTLLLNGIRSLYLEANEAAQSALNETMSRLAGVTPEYHDPGLVGSYPLIKHSTPLLSPLEKGDGLRLGHAGVGHALRLRATGARTLAESARVRPSPGFVIETNSAPTITEHRVGSGVVLFTAFSPARIAGCYPDEQATDCSAAATARGLMRWLVANLLWEEHRLQVVLPWETAGDTPIGVVITGDIHADQYNLQIDSAVQMVEIAEDIPLTFFVVGEVADRAPQQLATLKRHAQIEIATHSAHGDQYQRRRSGFLNRRTGGVYGARAVRDDVRRAEAMLGLPRWSESRGWVSTIRTEAWASNQTDAQAWTGMAEAGIALVFDHNADAILPRPQTSAPVIWFEGDIRQRLFIPMFEKNVATATDHFRLTPDLADRIVSLGSPEPDPCCNDAVDFATYADYVRRWHKAFRRLGVVGGLTEVWLWHPSTPALKNGFGDIEEILQSIRDDPRTTFFRASEIATWQVNRERLRVRPRYSQDGTIVNLELEGPTSGTLLPLPPGHSPQTATVSYWVLGKTSVPGWNTRHWQDRAGRTITVLNRHPNADVP